jgi:hypothetical protein
VAGAALELQVTEHAPHTVVAGIEQEVTAPTAGVSCTEGAAISIVFFAGSV